MKYIYSVLCLSLLFATCKKEKTILVDKTYVDSLITHYTLPRAASDNEKDMHFWKARIEPKNPGQTNEGRYASTFITRFHQFGDIEDVKTADSIINGINKTYNNSLGGPFLSLTSSAMLQHHFAKADTFLQKAKKIGVETAAAIIVSFDVDFELGKYGEASSYLKTMKKVPDYNYCFRQSKFDHLNGAIDSAITHMLKAADLGKKSPYLKGVALSNAADLYIHSGDLEKAADLYKECIRLNSVDFHSILGLGWIALIHDNNDSLAQRIYKFVLTKNKLPDPLFKLYQMMQHKGDINLEKSYARQFVDAATIPAYGQMYNKYTIEIYTGILNQPAKAETLAKNELNNRATPQTYAWYAYAMFMNGKKDEAYKFFEQHVSGQPLEGLELYYMGKLMKGMDKGYNARQFFKAAEKNLYDLSPAMQKDVTKNLEE